MSNKDCVGVDVLRTKEVVTGYKPHVVSATKNGFVKSRDLFAKKLYVVAGCRHSHSYTTTL